MTHEPWKPRAKVIQITSIRDTLTALCDDGGIWRYEDSGWVQIQDPPDKPPHP